MSYNIDTWKTKKLENLCIPLTAFFKHERQDWHPSVKLPANLETKESFGETKKTFIETKTVVLDCGCEQHIIGILSNGVLIASEFAMSGEGSGTFYDYILIPALEASTGILEAVLIWEGGDSISRLKVENGVVESSEIDL